MCVTVAIKLPRSRKSGEPKKGATWTLFKIRDRAYDPTYNFKTYDNGKSTTMYLVDEDSDWTECIRVNNQTQETELMFVNSALNNSLDKKDGTSKAKPTKNGTRKPADHGLIARRVARTSNLEQAVEKFSEMKFDGCTFISDGNRTFLIESSLPADAKKEISKERRHGENYRAVANIEDFITTTEEITDWLAVRTNHGITNEEAGYQKHDGISFKSSTLRRERAEEIIRQKVFEVSDILPAVESMGDVKIDANPMLRPRRVSGDIKDWNSKTDEKHQLPWIYSTSAFVMTAYGNVQIKLWDAEISKVNIQRIYAKDFPINVTITK